MPQTLLLADDSVTIQRVIELTFADEDIRVVAVSDGDQAIARIEAAPPDIILADVGMPGKNGYEVARYVKQSPRLAHIPVVLLTGAFEPIDQARAAEMGCEGVLAKPFEPQLVIGRVKELLGKGSAPSSGSAPPPSSQLADELFGAAAVAAPSAPPPPDANLDSYFDRLDKAFADLAAPGAASARPVAAPAPPVVDWFNPSTPADNGVPAEQWDIGGPQEAEPPTAQASAASAPARAVVPAPTPTPPPTPPPAAGPLPPLADAFAALLAAEQRAGLPPGAPQWPTPRTSPAVAAVAPEITEDVIEEVVRRVLARMSDAIVRERVSVMVSEIAERLVKAEIDRIKRSIS